MSFILISGSPGSGKTTLGNRLSKMGHKVYNSHDLARKFDAIDGYDEEFEVDIVDVEKIRDNLSKWEGKKGLHIIEGHYADIVPLDQLIHCFILDPEIEILRPRLMKRGYSKTKIDENIEAHIMQECYYDALEYYGETLVSILSGISIDDDVVEILAKIKSIE